MARYRPLTPSERHTLAVCLEMGQRSQVSLVDGMSKDDEYYKSESDWVKKMHALMVKLTQARSVGVTS